MVLITRLPPPVLCLPTFPNEEEALKSAAVRYFSVTEGKKQMRACRGMMICKQFFIVDTPFLLSIQGRAGCGDTGAL